MQHAELGNKSLSLGSAWENDPSHTSPCERLDDEHVLHQKRIRWHSCRYGKAGKARDWQCRSHKFAKSTARFELAYPPPEGRNSSP